MGALPGATTWQLYQYGFGPYLDGLFSQSNFGIITKLGVWLMPKPARFRPYMFTFPREQDLGAVVEILRPLRLSGVVQNAATIRSLLLEAAGGASRDQYCPGGGPVPSELYPQIMADQQIGFWNFYGAQYGTEAVIDAWWAQIRAAFADIPGARWYLEEDRPPGSVLAHRARRMSGTPGLEDLKILDWAAPGGGHINVSPICPASGPDAWAQYQMARDLCRRHGQDIMSDIIVGGRELHQILMIVFDRDSAEAKRQCLNLAVALVAEAAARGWGVYRTHLALMNQVAATYSWGDDALLRFTRILKDAVDPGQVLAPGKSGI
jgi:4-cresol dehydrogenase (hydroxylating)